jgi:hypothetical protein
MSYRLRRTAAIVLASAAFTGAAALAGTAPTNAGVMVPGSSDASAPGNPAVPGFSSPADFGLDVDPAELAMVGGADDGPAIIPCL